MKRTLLLRPACSLLSFALPASATDPCPQLRTRQASTDVATRMAAVACQGNPTGFRPFIEADGRASGQAVYEAESAALADGEQARRKVAAYWDGSGLGSGCDTAGAACRSFVVDAPWPAAFVSWVGGNVQQTVALRMLRLDDAGPFRRTAGARRHGRLMQPRHTGVLQPQPAGLGGVADAEAGGIILAASHRVRGPVTVLRHHI